jgi:enamine deaminase RidA (YjgF/YER057c/UK114 family)
MIDADLIPVHQRAAEPSAGRQQSHAGDFGRHGPWRRRLVVVAPPGARLVFVSGQIPMTAEGTVPEGAAAQAQLAFANVGRALAAAGAGWDDVVKFTFFVTDMEVLGELRAARDAVVDASRPPASSLVQVAGLVRPGLLLEIEAIAVTGP